MGSSPPASCRPNDYVELCVEISAIIRIFLSHSQGQDLAFMAIRRFASLTRSAIRSLNSLSGGLGNLPDIPKPFHWSQNSG